MKIKRTSNIFFPIVLAIIGIFSTIFVTSCDIFFGEKENYTIENATPDDLGNYSLNDLGDEIIVSPKKKTSTLSIKLIDEDVQYSSYISISPVVGETQKKSIQYTNEVLQTSWLRFQVTVASTIFPVFTIKLSTNQERENPYKFIGDRTFSIRANNYTSTGTYYGTGWIYKRISGYQYYMLTNWHVTYPWVSPATNNTTSEYSFSSLMYATLPSNAYLYDLNDPQNLINLSNSYTSFSTSSIMFNYSGTLASSTRIDAQILKVNFGSSPNPVAQQKLDIVNTYCELHGGYAMDAPLINTDVKNSPVWVAGYPGYPFDGGMQCVKWNKINDRIVNVYSNQHTIDDIGAFSTINSYDLELTSAANLHGGSSGSMIITTTNDDWKYKVVGIYWGGYYNSSSGTWLRGMGTALKTSSYNLLTF